MRYSICVILSLVLTACQTTQTVIVQSYTEQTAGQQKVNQTEITVVKINEPQPSQNKGRLDQPVDPTSSNKINEKNLTEVTNHCEKEAIAIMANELKCKSPYSTQKCLKSQRGEELYLSEFKRCLKKFGWKPY